ncbi:MULTISPECIES: MJ0042-type zinc finger domain-containing protein [Rhodopseudomonas]|uniref:Thioredoxin n=1 Tax=Rhodopseudomonas palustris TaxID=1076 RepID=A0A0D7EEY5_RHOPL|nr:MULTISPECIES: MJ0042-type zinc finger domain-containing protein [Rhodopseudomonas]KIZ39095.1 thioredoxin [Rhodopseudomonas palustris]MDF3809728.1 zinc-ribbon domain-containing protein [Rhodopseudomonas sp. BAL398]WOK16059.1 zinc-ribbon domain-containing protein [Rhodopseudomonas sp. BAL398]
MHIVCPHCTTSYAIDPSTLGDTGRTVRCSRCKQVWLARAEDAAQTGARVAAMTASAAPGLDNDPGWGDLGDDNEAPEVDSPSISTEMPEARTEAWTEAEPSTAFTPAAEPEIPPQRRDEDFAETRSFARPRPPSRLARLLGPLDRLVKPVRSLVSAPIACAAMGALVVALLVWRADVVRLMPQTATFFKLVGFEVNLRHLAIKDVKISTETVENKPVLVIEGVIIGQGRKPASLPRLRFVVRDEHGTEIYAWNAVLEQAVLRPGEKAWFRSRLASPPAQARSIDIRFFSRRDMASGAA